MLVARLEVECFRRSTVPSCAKLALLSHGKTNGGRNMSANFTCDLSGTSSPLKHAWEHTAGSSRALLALRADWQHLSRVIRKYDLVISVPDTAVTRCGEVVVALPE